MIKPLLICGIPNSGKSIIQMLLDGSEDILSIPYWHDGIGNVLAYHKHERNEILPQLLDEAYWDAFSILDTISRRTNVLSLLELLAHQGKMLYTPFRRRDVAECLDFPFDYYVFRTTMIDTLLGIDCSDFKQVWDAIYRALQAGLGRGSGSYPAYGVSMLNNDFFRYPMLDDLYGEYRMIFVHRDVRESMAVWIRGLCVGEQGKSFRWHLERLRGYGLFRRYIQNQLMARAFAEHKPDRMKIITFAQLVLETETTMRDVGKWLDLPWSDLMLRPSVLGQPNPHCRLGTIADVELSRLNSPDDLALLDQTITKEEEEARTVIAPLLEDMNTQYGGHVRNE